MILNLPKLVIYEITKHLNHWQIIHLLTSCKKLYSIYKNENFWIALSKYHFNLKPIKTNNFNAMFFHKKRSMNKIYGYFHIPYPSKILKFGQVLVLMRREYCDGAINYFTVFDVNLQNSSCYSYDRDINHLPTTDVSLYPIVSFIINESDRISFNAETREFFLEKVSIERFLFKTIMI